MNRYNFARICCYLILINILKRIGLTFSDWEYHVIVATSLLLVLFTYFQYKTKKELKKMSNWKPIETAPKDGTRFIAKIGGAVYGGYYDKYGRFCWIMHSNKAAGRVFQREIINGLEYQREITPEGAANYQPEAKLWMAGFEDKPTHWMPLPELPDNEN